MRIAPVATLPAVERTRRRTPAPAARLALVSLAVLATVLLTGCGAGFKATAVQPYAASDGVEANSGDLRVINALVVASPGITSGVISASVVNRGTRADTLTGISSPDGSVHFSGPATVTPGLATTLGADTRSTATITGLTRLAGESITLRLTFRRAHPVTLHTVVVAASGAYASVTSSPSPTAS
jgi:copper(I)-binding protein